MSDVKGWMPKKPDYLDYLECLKELRKAPVKIPYLISGSELQTMERLLVLKHEIRKYSK